MSVKTVALREYPKGCFDRIGMVIWDEIHLMCKLAKACKRKRELLSQARNCSALHFLS